MTGDRNEPVTNLLSAMHAGDPQAAERLFPIVYAQLRQLAQRQLANEFGQVTLAPTDLVHEAYLKLYGGDAPQALDRRHFFAVAARAMRQVLVDRARRRDAQKRDGGERITLTADLAADARSPLDLLALDQALTRLAEVDARKARAIELRVFAGIDFEQIADTLGVSRATLARDYRGAQAWLYRALNAGEPAA
ncbi:MAG: sigma-70 family RNA polymerase sigma factor [Proteobacteria bacterium]|nr:sigma-70 family RNA polymerase sigma factor [Pseudomonadota bacterium]